MRVKELSQNGKDYFVRNLNKEYKEEGHKHFGTLREYLRNELDYYRRNKKAGLLNYRLLK